MYCTDKEAGGGGLSVYFCQKTDWSVQCDRVKLSHFGVRAYLGVSPPTFRVSRVAKYAPASHLTPFWKSHPLHTYVLYYHTNERYSSPCVQINITESSNFLKSIQHVAIC